jgi:hypothetical protein
MEIYVQIQICRTQSVAICRNITHFGVKRKGDKHYVAWAERPTALLYD